MRKLVRNPRGCLHADIAPLALFHGDVGWTLLTCSSLTSSLWLVIEKNENNWKAKARWSVSQIKVMNNLSLRPFHVSTCCYVTTTRFQLLITVLVFTSILALQCFLSGDKMVLTKLSANDVFLNLWYLITTQQAGKHAPLSAAPPYSKGWVKCFYFWQ